MATNQEQRLRNPSQLAIQRAAWCRSPRLSKNMGMHSKIVGNTWNAESLGQETQLNQAEITTVSQQLTVAAGTLLQLVVLSNGIIEQRWRASVGS